MRLRLVRGGSPNDDVGEASEFNYQVRESVHTDRWVKHGFVFTTNTTCLKYANLGSTVYICKYGSASFLTRLSSESKLSVL